VPAPVRGEAVRRIALALRKYKDPLGSLVAMENGKIKAEGDEGDGEVQEMIDIADFAVGQSRMLYGRTMHSERPQHRMYEQWHPLGLVGTISAFNFPVAVYAWNACIAAVCGNVNIWKPSHSTALCGIAVQKIINEALADMDLPPVFFLINQPDLIHGIDVGRPRRW
jgi:aldehyde dehydrogenase (NAD+)